MENKILITPKQGLVMEVLANNPDKVFTLQELTALCFTDSFVATTRSINAIIVSLVAKELVQRGHKKVTVRFGPSVKEVDGIQLGRGITVDDYVVKNK